MIVCLTGMHRSGTSLMGNFLHRCGISMGKELIGAARGNRFGHFEDAEFVSFHCKLLNRRGCQMYSPARNLEFTDQEARQAQALVEQRQRDFGNWGWKDPRTTLFLGSWHRIIPEVRYIFLYRSPHSVIDSLLRRATDRRLKMAPWLAASAWIRYNEDIISFYKTHKAQALLVNIHGFNHDHASSVNLLEDWLGIELPVSYTDVYHPSELKTAPAGQRRLTSRLIDKVYGKRMDEIYRTLESLAAIRGG